ncbi:hypothetical protein EDD86DRAFT_198247 [Gorgonomyces haynaldii]|nr:hypothetical protein EDD86DRAFT_198247 [Gorgonomyces haynaldii]
MGALLSILLKQKEEDPINVPIDFNAAPTAEESNYQQLIEICRQSNDIIKQLQQYKGCGEFIRKAISSPTKENEEACWRELQPMILDLKMFYEHSVKLEQNVLGILQLLAKGDVLERMGQCQATSVRLADLLAFCSEFDAVKMNNPNIQNDFSYYRRTVSKMKMQNSNLQIVVSDELANRMSLFFAHATPMTKSLIDSAQSKISTRSLNPQVVDAFAALAGIAYHTVNENRTTRDKIYYLRIMTTSILFYDHLHPAGAFTKESKINVRSSVKLLQQHGGDQTESFINSIKFSSVHLNDESTPKATKQCLGL